MIAFSAIVVLIPDVNLLGMMLTAQFVNGVILPILLALMAIISADKYIMGDYRSGTRVEGASVGHRRCGGGAHRGAARDAGAGARIAVRSVRSIRPPRLSCRLRPSPLKRSSITEFNRVFT